MDLRVQRTRHALKNALFNLVSERNFEEITVKDLCIEANVNRITFYDHYKDKYDLLNEIFKEIDFNASEQAKILDRENNMIKDLHQSLVNYLLSYVKELMNYEPLIVSMAHHMSGYIYFSFMSFLTKKFQDLITYYKQERNLIYSMDQTTAFVCNGIISFVIAGIINSKSKKLDNIFFQAQALFHDLIDNSIIITK